MRQRSAWGLPLLMVAAIGVACTKAPVAPGYDFITHSLPSGLFGPQMASLLEGGLARAGSPEYGGSCLVVVRGSRDVTFVAWPSRFSLVLASDGRFEVHGDGKVFRQGETVRLGGGEITGGVHHSMPGACPSSYYFAAESFP